MAPTNIPTCTDCGEWAAMREPALCLHCAYIRVTARMAFMQFTPVEDAPKPKPGTFAAHFQKGLPQQPSAVHYKGGKTWPELVAEAL